MWQNTIPHRGVTRLKTNVIEMRTRLFDSFVNSNGSVLVCVPRARTSVFHHTAVRVSSGCFFFFLLVVRLLGSIPAGLTGCVMISDQRTVFLYKICSGSSPTSGGCGARVLDVPCALLDLRFEQDSLQQNYVIRHYQRPRSDTANISSLILAV